MFFIFFLFFDYFQLCPLRFDVNLISFTFALKDEKPTKLSLYECILYGLKTVFYTAFMTECIRT